MILSAYFAGTATAATSAPPPSAPPPANSAPPPATPAPATPAPPHPAPAPSAPPPAPPVAPVAPAAAPPATAPVPAAPPPAPGGPAPTAPAPAVTSGTEKTLNELRQDTLHRALLEAPLARADQALTRVRSMERAGDTVHAALLRAVADKWLALARDLVRTADMEAKAEAAERTLDDLETKMVRGRALLEETVARRGRAQETLEQLEKTPRPPAGKTKPEAPKKAPAATPSTESEEPRR